MFHGFISDSCDHFSSRLSLEIFIRFLTISKLFKFVSILWKLVQTQAWSASSSWTPSTENVQSPENLLSGHVAIPTDGTDVWEIDVRLLKFGAKVASGSYGDL